MATYDDCNFLKLFKYSWYFSQWTWREETTNWEIQT